MPSDDESAIGHRPSHIMPSKTLRKPNDTNLRMSMISTEVKPRAGQQNTLLDYQHASNALNEQHGAFTERNHMSKPNKRMGGPKTKQHKQLRDLSLSQSAKKI